MRPRFTRRRWLAATAAAAAAGGFAAPAVLRAAEGQWGDLVGRFVYDGKAPERKRLKVDKDVEFCGKFDIRDESLMVGPDGSLANVFVYLRTPKVPISPEPDQLAAEADRPGQRGLHFQAALHGNLVREQEFRIVNSDPIAQNVDFRPTGDTPANIVLPACDAKKSSDGKPAGKVEATWKFNRPQIEPILIKCNYHPWESGYILIRANPYYAVSAPDGTFRIPKLPAGRLEFQLWHERVGPLDSPGWSKGRSEVEIRPGTSDLGTIRLAPARFEKSYAKA